MRRAGSWGATSSLGAGSAAEPDLFPGVEAVSTPLREVAAGRRPFVVDHARKRSFVARRIAVLRVGPPFGGAAREERANRTELRSADQRRAASSRAWNFATGPRVSDLREGPLERRIPPSDEDHVVGLATARTAGRARRRRLEARARGFVGANDPPVADAAPPPIAFRLGPRARATGQRRVWVNGTAEAVKGGPWREFSVHELVVDEEVCCRVEERPRRRERFVEVRSPRGRVSSLPGEASEDEARPLARHPLFEGIAPERVVERPVVGRRR